MTTTVQISETPRRNHVVAIVNHNGQHFGQVVMRGRLYNATRRTGTDDDMRRVAFRFATIDRAVAWINAAAQ